MFIRFLFERVTFSTTPVYEMIRINCIDEITLVLSLAVIVFTQSIWTLYEKISLCRFFRKVSTVTPIGTKQETVWPTLEGGSSQEENAWFWNGPTRQRQIWTKLIQLVFGRVGDGTSNSPNGELDLVDPTRRWASWKWFITRPTANWKWFITRPTASWKWFIGRVSPMVRTMLVWLFRRSGIVHSMVWIISCEELVV